MKALRQEFKLALTSLTSVAGFSATIIVTLALTLGALICIFNLNHLLLMKDLPYPEADKLVVMDQSTHIEGDGSSSGQTLPGMLLWYKNQTQMSDMALIHYETQSYTEHSEQPRIPVAYATPELFSLLSIPMHLGRSFSEEEGLDQNRPVIVLSYASWKKWFKSNNKVIGSKTQVGDISYTIIGVTAESFIEPQIYRNKDVEAWLAWDYQSSDPIAWGMKTGSIKAIGKLKSGVSLDQASAILAKQLNIAYKDNENYEAGFSLSADLKTLKQSIVGNSQNIALLLLAGVIGLLLIAATNVTNLFLSRAAQKQRTMAIQAALGAKPSHLFTAMFAESLILCTVAALAGLVLAGWGFVILQELASAQLPRLAELGIDWVTLLFTILTTLILSAVFAKLSSRVVRYDDLKGQLQSSGKGAGLQISAKTRNLLIASQVALASILLIGASIVIEQSLTTVFKPIGFNTEQVYHLRIDQGESYEDRESLDLLTYELRNKLSGLPQVEQVSRALMAPIGSGRIRIDLNDINEKRLGEFRINLVDHNYFDLLQLPIIQGRTFTEQVNPNQNILEVILSESLARRLVPDGNAIGKVFMLDPEEPLKVVGVVADYFNPNDKDYSPAERYYLPFSSFIFIGFEIKVKADFQLNKSHILDLLKQINPDIRIAKFSALTQKHQDLIYRHKLAAGLAIVLTLLALTLAAAGIYGVLNYSTQMRRYELGIHLALGAKTERIISMVLKESFVPVVIGLVVSIFVSIVIYLVTKQYYAQAIELNQFALFVTFPIILLIAFIACYLPVRKVIINDPVKALRNE